jgi:hypothetical protein
MHDARRPYPLSADTGLCLPPEMAILPSKSPWLEGDVDRLIALNADVRIPGTPDAYAAVWFPGMMAEQHPSIGVFLLYLEVTFPDEKVALGEWRIVAKQWVGPIRFGMTRAEVRAALAQPFTAFQKGGRIRTHRRVRHTRSACLLQ